MISSDDESVAVRPTKSSKAEKEVILTKGPPRKKRVMTEVELTRLSQNRIKALATLTEQRKQKALEKDKIKAEESVIRQEIEVKKLDKAPKVKELDDTMALMKSEIELLKKQLEKPAEGAVGAPKKERKVRKIIYESDEEEAKPTINKTLTGNDLLDALFFK